jgi:hypothetical protein
MKMPNVHKRIEALERALAPKRDAAADQVIFRQVLHRLSVEDLKLLRGMAVDYQRGQLKLSRPLMAPAALENVSRDLTPGELAAITAYTAALQQELQSAGFSSVAEFERKYCRR